MNESCDKNVLIFIVIVKDLRKPFSFEGYISMPSFLTQGDRKVNVAVCSLAYLPFCFLCNLTINNIKEVNGMLQ